MEERRAHRRILLDAAVRLYHPRLGTVEGAIRDLSDSGVRVAVADAAGLSRSLNGESITLRPQHLDVLFDTELVRCDGDCVVLRFIEP